MTNFLTGSELQTIYGLLHYLNASARPADSDVGFDAKVIDSNGETLGEIKYTDTGYVFYLGETS